MGPPTTDVHYCVQWFRGKNYPADILTPEQARKRHEKGKLYTALLGDPAKPDCFLEFSAYRSVCVEFLDASLRSFRVLSFSEERPNQLFLESVVIRNFDHPSGEESDGHVYYFKTDGRLFIEHYRVGPTGPSLMIDSQESHADTSRNWESFPEFGHYERLAVFDRSIPALSQAERSGS